MKNLILYITAIFISGSAYAQQDAQAKALLSQVGQKYRSYNSIKADFTFTGDNPQAGDKISQTGILIAKSKVNKFKISLYDKGKKEANQEIYSDGKTQWTYNRADKEVQVGNAGKADDEFNPAQIFTIFERGYKYISSGVQKVGKLSYQVVDLSPTAADKNIFKIRLLIDKTKKQLYSAQIFDKSGARYTYTINNLSANYPAPDNVFVYDKGSHPGVEVVDLR